MASAVSALKEHVTCHVCLQVFEHPVMLPCQHSVCLSCFKKIFSDNSGSVPCPLCRHICQQSPSNLPPNLTIKSFLETFRSLKIQEETGALAAAAPPALLHHLHDRCFIPACRQPPASLCPCCNRHLCQRHVDSHVADVVLSKDDMLADIDKRIGEQGYLKHDMLVMKQKISLTQQFQKKSEAMFREMEKAFFLAKEEALAEIDIRLRKMTEMEQELKETSDYFVNMKDKLLRKFESGDMNGAVKLIREFQPVVKSTEYSTFNNASVPDFAVPINSINESWTSCLRRCKIVDNNRQVLTKQEIESLVSKETFGKKIRSSNLPFQVRQINVCTNTKGYVKVQSDSESEHESNADSESNHECYGYVKKGEDGENLPESCFIALSDDGDFYMLDMDTGNIISCIHTNFHELEQKLFQYQFNIFDFCVDSTYQSLFLFVFSDDVRYVIRTDLSGQLLESITNDRNGTIKCFVSSSPVISTDVRLFRFFITRQQDLDQPDLISVQGFTVTSDSFTKLCYLKHIDGSTVITITTSYDCVYVLSVVNVLSVNKTDITRTRTINTYSVDTGLVTSQFSLNLSYPPTQLIEFKFDTRGFFFIVTKTVVDLKFEILCCLPNGEVISKFQVPDCDVICTNNLFIIIYYDSLTQKHRMIYVYNKDGVNKFIEINIDH